jgi:hypothetical protein
MDTLRMIPRLLGAAGAALLALPGAAEAASLASLKPCYVSVTEQTREGIDVVGNGFTANAMVDLALDGQVERTIQADANGNLPPQVLQAPFQARRERAFSLSATERGNPANAVTLTSNVTALSLGVQPRRARPSKRVTFRGRGFTNADPVYAHYLFKGRLRKTVTLERRTGGPCGTFTSRRRQIPVKRPKTGTWTLQVDQQRRYSRAPRSVFIRVSIVVQRVFRLRSR